MTLKEKLPIGIFQGLSEATPLHHLTVENLAEQHI